MSGPGNSESPASTWKLPATLPTAARHALSMSLHIADEHGVVAVRRLRTLLGIGEEPMRRTVVQLESHRLVRRLAGGTHHGSRFRIAYSRIFRGDDWPTCEHCPRPVLVGTGYAHRYCAVCMATIVRHDRRWREHAFEVWASAPKGDSEAKTVYRIHMQTSQPIFTRKGIEAGETKEGIVNWMLSLGLLREPSWQTRARAYKEGEEGE